MVVHPTDPAPHFERSAGFFIFFYFAFLRFLIFCNFTCSTILAILPRMNLHILAIGKKKSEYDAQIAEYQKRITVPFSLTCEILEPAGIDHKEQSRLKESEKLLAKIKPGDFMIIMDEHGKDFTTVQFSQLLEKHLTAGTKRIVLIIGGSYGLDESIITRGNQKMRLGAFTLPHELARLILVEQLYRTTNLLSGGKYHHE